MRLVGLVVDHNCMPIAFKIEGKLSDFGSLGDAKVVNAVTLTEVMASRFKNNQLNCSSGKMYEVGKFRKSDLPTEMYLPNGTYVPFDNTITLQSRLLENGKLAGFKVAIGDRLQKNFRSNDIIKLSSWFKCGNFMIQSRKSDDGRISKVYISGKPGHAVSDLPEIELGADSKVNKRARAKSVTDASVRVTSFDPLEFDIVSLFNTVRDLNGYIVKLPNTKYNTTHKQETVTGKGFIELGVGEVASPYLDFPEKSMAVNADFRKIGNVSVNYNGAKIPLPTYVIKKKSIFVNGQNNIKKFGIVVGEAQVKQLKEAFAGSLALEPVQSEKMVFPIRSMYGDNTLQMFTVDTSNIDIISKKKIASYLLSEEDIFKKSLRMVELKTAFRYINSVKASAKEAMASSGVADTRPKYGMYAGFSDDLLKVLTDSGIDIFSGIYTVKEEADNKKAEAASVNQMLQNGVVPKEEARYEVEYGIAGFKTIPSAADITKKADKVKKYLTPFVLQLMEDVSKAKTVESMFHLADEAVKAINKEKGSILKELWLHKMACISAGNYGYFSTNPDNWKMGKPSKNTSVHDYTCSKPGLETLTLKLTNLDLK